MQSKAATVEKYLAELPADRRDAINQVRRVILKNLPAGYEEGMQYGMIGYYVPHSLYPPGYHCDPKQPLPFAGLASQKNHMSMYMMCVYTDPQHNARFQKEWIAAGKKLDMGKGCVRFKKVEDVPLSVVGGAIKRVSLKKFIDHYESVIKPGGKRKKSADPAPKAKKSTTAKAKKKSAPTSKKKAKSTAKSTAKSATKSKIKSKARKSAR